MIGIGACVALLFGGISSCSMMAGSGVGGVFTSSYLSEDADMLAAEAAYCELEQELQYELDHYEALHPGYDEYRFDLDEIEHDPYVLISILTAFHEGGVLRLSYQVQHRAKKGKTLRALCVRMKLPHTN